MKIEELIKIYEFLARSGLFGAIASWLITSFVVLYLLLLGQDKLKIVSKKHLIIVLTTVALFIALGFVLLTWEAKGRLRVLELANCIKSEYIMAGYKSTSLTNIKVNFHCKYDGKPPSDEDLARIIDSYPYEFVSVKTDDGAEGLRMIDGAALAAIDTYNKVHLPFLKSQILDFMQHNHRDSISYFDIRNEINEDFDDEWIELMISTYDTLFIPYYSPSKKDSLYGVSHGIRMRKG